MQALKCADPTPPTTALPIAEPSKPIQGKGSVPALLAKQSGYKRQHSNFPVLPPEPKKHKTVYNEFSSSTGASSSSDHSDSQPVKPAQPIIRKPPAKRNAKSKLPVQKENQPVNKLRKQPARNAASIYATQHVAHQAKAPSRKAAAKAHASGTLAAVQQTLAKTPSATGKAPTYTRKRPSQTGIQNDPAVSDKQMQLKGAVAKQPPGKALSTKTCPSHHIASRQEQTTTKQPARQSGKAVDDLLTAMLSQDDVADPSILPAKANESWSDYPNNRTCSRVAAQPTELAAASGGNVLGDSQLNKADNKSATQAQGKIEQWTRNNSVQACDEQGPAIGIFSKNMQASLKQA